MCWRCCENTTCTRARKELEVELTRRTIMPSYHNDGTGRDGYINNCCLSEKMIMAAKNPAGAEASKFWSVSPPKGKDKSFNGSLSGSGSLRSNSNDDATALPRVPFFGPDSLQSVVITPPLAPLFAANFSGSLRTPRRDQASPSTPQEKSSPRSSLPLGAIAVKRAIPETETGQSMRCGRFPLRSNAPPPSSYHQRLPAIASPCR